MSSLKYPTCDKPILSRMVKVCSYCSPEIPVGIRFSDEEIELTKKREMVESKNKAEKRRAEEIEAKKKSLKKTILHVVGAILTPNPPSGSTDFKE